MYVYYSAKPKLNFANDYIFKMSNISMGVGRPLLQVFKRKVTLNCTKLYFDLGLKTFCLFDFPLNTPIQMQRNHWVCLLGGLTAHSLRFRSV